MEFNVTAKRFGNSVKFPVEAPDTKAALTRAKAEAKIIFDYKAGEAGEPTVSVVPAVVKE